MRKNTSGFTIVELLIVIVVIGILAAITIVAYNGIQNRAYDASVRSDLSQIAKKFEIAKNDSTTLLYPYGNPAMSAANMGIKINKNAYYTSPDASYNLLICYPSTSNPTEMIVLGYSKSGKRLYMRNSNTIIEYTGGVSWGGGSANTICDSLSSGWIAGGAAYSSGDTTTGPWRSWANVN